MQRDNICNTIPENLLPHTHTCAVRMEELQEWMEKLFFFVKGQVK